jgi:hypothetical protein
MPNLAAQGVTVNALCRRRRGARRGIIRRVDVQADDVSGLLFEVGIVPQHVAFESVRLQADTSRDPRHQDVTDPEDLRKLPGWSNGCRRAGS